MEENEVRNKNLDQIIKDYGFTGFNLFRSIPAQIRESIIENKEINGKYKKRDGTIIELTINPIAPVWIENKWFLLAYDKISNNELTLYCENFIEIF